MKKRKLNLIEGEKKKWDMRVVQNKKQISELAKKENIENYFDTKNLVFAMYQYEKGEVIASPDKPLKSILFLVEGIVQIYGILSDGGKLSVRLMSKPTLLGDVEFCGDMASPLFTEAMTDVTCLALPLDTYRSVLDRDVRFLHVLLQSLTRKMVMNSKSEVEMPTVEERVLFYMENIFENHEFHGIEETMVELRCSRRQLQRVMKKLCDEGKVIRVGKGKYRLINSKVL